jgi:pimeloyl-ACP methyl ester carboxylesterase
MKKLYVIATVAAMLMGATLLLEKTPTIAAAAPQTGIKNVVLVHGAFADGSGWEAVAKILEKDGYTVSVAQPPETSYADDQKYTTAAIDATGGPVVLVGHSYGGSIISEAGNDPNVAALVYIAAFALDEGDSCASIEQARPQASKAFKPIATATGGSTRTISRPTSQRIFLSPSPITWPYRRYRSPLTRLPTRSRVQPGRPSQRGTWWPPQTGRSIRTRSA